LRHSAAHSSRFINSRAGRVFCLVAGMGFLVVGYLFRHHTLGVIFLVYSVLPLSAGRSTYARLPRSKLRGKCVQSFSSGWQIVAGPFSDSSKQSLPLLPVVARENTVLRRGCNLRHLACGFQVQAHCVKWGKRDIVYKGRHPGEGEQMKELLTGNTTGNRADNQSSMATSIVDTMNRYFRDDRGNMGELERSIVASVQRYFEEPPPKRIA